MARVRGSSLGDNNMTIDGETGEQCLLVEGTVDDTPQWRETLSLPPFDVLQWSDFDNILRSWDFAVSGPRYDMPVVFG